ncbi:MAG TPA: nuclear transport factor 2 family protein [Chlamydiales bacterium]|nr:nuclear transport factor 2 family protein [Chlamydiales bacterium]
MSKNCAETAVAYYTEMSRKNLAGMEKHLHPDVQFSSPVMQLKGKDAVLEAASRLVTFFKTLTIRANFGTEKQAMLAIDIDFPAPIGNLPSAALLTCNDGLISRIELFFDPRIMEKKT